MTWTKTPPLKTGFYWWRGTKKSQPQPMELIDRKGRGNIVFRIGDSNLFKPGFLSGEWWDIPIPLPED